MVNVCELPLCICNVYVQHIKYKYTVMLLRLCGGGGGGRCEIKDNNLLHVAVSQFSRTNKMWTR